jgi:cytochrome o ubiquinol oxidase operon protein cyoD
MLPAMRRGKRTAANEEERRDFRSYAWGMALALPLTVTPFAMVYWGAGSRLTLLVVIGAFALVQMIVHFRFFLHLSFSEKREDLQLILFSTLVLLLMIGGTVWIMGSLMLRTALRGTPWTL